MQVKLNCSIYTAYRTLMVEAREFMRQTGQRSVRIGTLHDLVPESIMDLAYQRWGEDAIIIR